MRNDNIKLGDFGLSKELLEQASFTSTQVATPYHMSPDLVQDKVRLRACSSSFVAYAAILLEIRQQIGHLFPRVSRVRVRRTQSSVPRSSDTRRAHDLHQERPHSASPSRLQLTSHLDDQGHAQPERACSSPWPPYLTLTSTSAGDAVVGHLARAARADRLRHQARPDHEIVWRMSPWSSFVTHVVSASQTSSSTRSK
jgi:serine/threonine protein kinase